MSTHSVAPSVFEPSQFPKRQLFALAVLLTLGIVPFLVWPTLTDRVLASNFLPHRYCFLEKPMLVWTHVVADSSIGLAYLAISGTLAYLVHKGRRDIPFHWLVLAFGLFIVACGATHLVEVVTVWIPLYVLSGAVKVFTALASVATAVLLPVTVPKILTLLQTAKASERVTAELSQSDERFRKLVEALPDAIFVISEGRIVFVNPCGVRMVRAQGPEQIIGKSLSEIVHPDFWASIQGRMQECYRTGVASSPREHVLVALDGSSVEVESAAIPIVWKGSRAIEAIARDVRPRKRAEATLQRSEGEAKARAEELAVILDAVPGMTLISRDPDCHNITGSRVAYELLRLPYGANLSKSAPGGERPSNFRVMKDGRELSTGELPLRRAATGQQVRDSEITLLFEDGASRDMLGNAAPLLDQKGEVRGAVGVFVDITERNRAQAALGHSEERFRLAAGAGKMFAYEWDAATDVIVRSAESAQILGIDETVNLTGRQVLAKVHPEDQERLKAAMAELRPDKASLQISYRMIRPDGAVIWLERNSRAQFDAHGKMLRIVGMVGDITDRKRAEQALRESEDQYRDLVEHSQDLLCTHDLKGKLLSCNPAPARILGYEVSELLQIPLRQLIVPEYREQFDAYLARVKTAGTDRGLMAVVTRTGERRIWEYNNTLRTEGVPTPIVRGMARDITERTRAERELQQVQTRIETVLESVADNHILFDRDWHYLYVNRAAVLAMGRPREQILGRTLWEIYPDTIGSELDRQYRRAMDERIPVAFDFYYPTTNTWWDNRFYPVPEGLSVFATNITERKKAEEAVQKSQAALARVTRIAAMGELTASIAHEIKQPLTAAITNASAARHWLAVEPPNLEEARDAAARAIEDVNRASGVIERIRALIQKAQPQLQPLDGNEVIREVLLLADTELRRGGVAVKTDFAADLPAVLGDRVQLQQVMLNLILNAIDAMSAVTDRRRELLIRSAHHPDGVLVQVRDSGRGIDTADADRIFEPFFTTKPQGIGMGLTISGSIIEAHGGHLWATGGSPHGTIFQFTLPTPDDKQ